MTLEHALALHLAHSLLLSDHRGDVEEVLDHYLKLLGFDLPEDWDEEVDDGEGGTIRGAFRWLEAQGIDGGIFEVRRDEAGKLWKIGGLP